MRRLLILLCLAQLWLSPALAEEVVFQSGPDKLYGTLELPTNFNGKVPALLLLSGSGPTDRDGNSPLLTGRIDSHKHLAELLAQQGVASLRYDKIFSGKTGPASHAADPAAVGIDTFVEAADAAYQFLADRPEIDTQQLAILGHSEGGLIALILAKDKNPVGLKGLILAMPMSEPYLKTVYDQVAAQFEAAEASGHLPSTEGEEQLDYLRAVIEEIKTTGTAPTRDKLMQSLQTLFAPTHDHYLQTVSVYDPAELAQGLDLPILVLEGERDVQVTSSMIDHLMTGLQSNPRAQRLFLKDTNHVFKIVPEDSVPASDYVDPSREFSPQADQAILDWVQANLSQLEPQPTPTR
jgi:alpha-beta hydrolase superfamily lysophospholipase